MKRFIFVLFVLFIIFSCQEKEKKLTIHDNIIDYKKPTSWGQEQKIFIFCDDKVWETMQDSLRNGIARIEFTTEEEEIFLIERAPFDLFEDYYKFKNILFIGNLGERGEVGDFLKTTLGNEIITSVSQGGPKIFVRTNLWANDQFITFLVANNINETKAFYEKVKDKIFELFYNRLKERQGFQAYRTELHNNYIFKKHPFEIPVPQSYMVLKNSPEEHFIYFLNRFDSRHPDKYLSVYYEKMPEEQFTSEWIINKRDEIGEKYYKGDVVVRRTIKVEQYKLGNNPKGYKISGVWANEKWVAGGPFRTFGFYDKNTKTAFIIDTNVFFPQGFKVKPLIELEMICKNFKIKPLSQMEEK